MGCYSNFYQHIGFVRRWRLAITFTVVLYCIHVITKFPTTTQEWNKGSNNVTGPKLKMYVASISIIGPIGKKLSVTRHPDRVKTTPQPGDSWSKLQLSGIMYT